MKITYERPDYCTGCKFGKLHLKETKLYGDNQCYACLTYLECENDELCQQFYERISKIKKVTPYEASYWNIPCAHCKSLAETEKCYACLTDDKNGLGKTRFIYEEL